MVPRSFGKNPSSSRQPLFSFFPSSTTVVIFLDLFFLSFVYTPYIEWCLIHLSRSLSLSSCDTPWLHPPPPPPPPRHPSCFSSVLSTRRPLCFYYFVDRRTSEKETIPKDKKTKKKKKKKQTINIPLQSTDHHPRRNDVPSPLPHHSLGNKHTKATTHLEGLGIVI